MGAVPADVETDAQPPMTIPLRHFVVGFGFLLLGGLLGVGRALGVVGGLSRFAYLHLLLVGWVCVTIMGAMTQFVPVWSGVSLHSRRLATHQLSLVCLGVLGLAAAFLTGAGWLFLSAGLLLVAGFYAFVYNIGRTLAAVDSLDITEGHFALALGFFTLLAPLGFLLAATYAGHAHSLPVSRAGIVGTHATVAVFGAVLTTVLGALYQLGTMFTQTDLHGVDTTLKRVETVTYPLGVLGLAGGRLFEVAVVATAGGLLVVAGLLAIAAVLARRLVETRVEWTPMLTRYGLVVVAILVWAVPTVPAWFADPLARSAILGGPDVQLLLVLGIVGFVVLGTLYHIVPFIVWVHRYSDRLGFEQVPMIDDLYDGRLAAVDCWLFVVGVALVVGAVLVPTGSPVAADTVRLVGASLYVVGVMAFVANMLLVVVRHSPETLRAVVGGRPADA